MPITYPIALPSTPGTRRVKWDYEFARGRARSDFTGKSQSYVWPKKLLKVGAEYPPMARAQAEAWIAALRVLDEGACLFGDPQGATPRGLVANYALNLLRWSEELERPPSGQANLAITIEATADPLGLVTGEKIAAVASAATVFNLSAVGAGTPLGLTFSIYVKKGSGATDANGFALYTPSLGSIASCSINYDTGVLTPGAGVSTVQNVGGGWYRVTMAGTGMVGGETMSCYICFPGGSETAGEYAYAWGAQLEVGVVATAYKPVGDLPVYSDIARDFLLFDGVDDYVSVPHNAAYNSNNLTVEFWFRAPAAVPAATSYLTTKWDGSGLDREWSIYMYTDGTLTVEVSKTDNSANVAIVTAASYADGKWHHVALSKAAGGALTLYVDGAQKGTAALGQEGDQTTHPVRLANSLSGAGGSPFAGPICEFRIWNTVRTLAQIRANLSRQLVGNESGLVGYWRVDDRSGTALDDLTSTNNNGTVSGALWSGLAATEILVANLAGGRAGMLELGDWLQIGSGKTQRIYETVGSNGGVAAAASNAGGVAHVEIRPGLREIPADQAAIVVSNTKGVFELEDVVVGHEVDVAEKYGIAFTLVEAF